MNKIFERKIVNSFLSIIFNICFGCFKTTVSSTNHNLYLSPNLWKPALMTESSKFSWLHTLNLQSVKKLFCKFFEVISIIHGNMVFWNYKLSKL